jgi:hypothetical protein
MSRVAAGVTVLALTWLLSACLDSSRSIDSNDRVACIQRSTAICDRLERCTNGVRVKILYGNVSTCTDRQNRLCLAERSSGGSKMTAQDLSTCAGATEAQSCDDYLAGASLSACVFAGDGKDGVPCRFGSQCQSGFCAITSNRSCGFCAARPQEGDSCANVGCGPGLLCNGLTCVRYLPGAPCDRLSRFCPPGLQCVGSSTSAPDQLGVCTVALRQAGAPCDPDRITLAGCDGRLGLFCAQRARVCTRYAFAEAGGMCVEDENTVTACLASGVCEPTRTSTSIGLCLAPQPDGAACDLVSTSCLAPAVCVTSAGGGIIGACLLPDALECPGP